MSILSKVMRGSLTSHRQKLSKFHSLAKKVCSNNYGHKWKYYSWKADVKQISPPCYILKYVIKMLLKCLYLMYHTSERLMGDFHMPSKFFKQVLTHFHLVSIRVISALLFSQKLALEEDDFAIQEISDIISQ